MWPELFGIPTYILVYTLGVVLHGPLLQFQTNRFGMNKKDAPILGVLYALAMFPGARLLSDVLNHRFDIVGFFSANYWTCEDRWALWGGPLVYLVLAALWVLTIKRNDRNARDFAVAVLPVAMIVAKLACYTNGCCYGTPSNLPWAITFPDGADAPPGVPIHPTQIYEILVLCIVVAVFARLDRHRWRGTWPAWFLAIHGAGRMLTEFCRPPETQRFVVASLTASQWLCAIASLVAIIWLARAPHHSTVGD